MKAIYLIHFHTLLLYKSKRIFSSFFCLLSPLSHQLFHLPKDMHVRTTLQLSKGLRLRIKIKITINLTPSKKCKIKTSFQTRSIS